MLAEIISQQQTDGGNGSRFSQDRTRNVGPSPYNGPSSFTGRGAVDPGRNRRPASDRAPAMDRDGLVDTINRSGFLRRFPDAAKISILG
jgi:hypothetical protein